MYIVDLPYGINCFLFFCMAVSFFECPLRFILFFFCKKNYLWLTFSISLIILKTSIMSSLTLLSCRVVSQCLSIFLHNSNLLLKVLVLWPFSGRIPFFEYHLADEGTKLECLTIVRYSTSPTS